MGWQQTKITGISGPNSRTNHAMFAVGWIYSSVLFFAVKRGRICMNMYKLSNLNKRRRVCKMEIWLRDISVYISGLNNVGQTCFTWRIMAWYNFYTPDVRISSRDILNLNLNIYLTSRVQQKSGFLAQQKLVGGLEHFLFSPIVGMMTQSDELIFFRGVGIPPTRHVQENKTSSSGPSWSTQLVRWWYPQVWSTSIVGENHRTTMGKWRF